MWQENDTESWWKLSVDTICFNLRIHTIHTISGCTGGTRIDKQWPPFNHSTEQTEQKFESTQLKVHLSQNGTEHGH